MEQEEFIEWLIDFFKRKDPKEDFKDFKRQKYCPNETIPRYLLCLDNAEELIENSSGEFKNFVSSLQENCPLLNILITASAWKRQFYEDVPDS